MQAAVWWSHYSVSKKSLLLNVPPLDTSYIQRYNDNAYVQCVSLRVYPWIIPYQKQKPKAKNRSSRADDIASNEIPNPRNHNIRLKLASVEYNSDTGENEPGPCLIKNFKMTKNQLQLHEYVEQFNETAANLAPSVFVFPPVFIDWVPMACQGDDNRDVKSWLENVSDEDWPYALGEKYSAYDVPVGANPYKLRSDIPNDDFYLRFWCAPNVTVAWAASSVIAMLGFDREKSKTTKRMQLTNNSNDAYKYSPAVASPVGKISKNTLTDITIYINVKLDLNFGFSLPPDSFQNFDEAYEYVKDVCDKISKSINFNVRVTAKENTSAGYYALFFIVSGRFMFELQFDSTLQNALWLPDGYSTNKKPMMDTSWRMPEESQPADPPDDSKGQQPPSSSELAPVDPDPQNPQSGTQPPVPPDIKTGNVPVPDFIPAGQDPNVQPVPATFPNVSPMYDEITVDDQKYLSLKYPTLMSDQLSAYTRDIGYIYGIVSELYQMCFPGRVFFILSPGEQGWTLLDAPALTISCLLRKRELEKINTNPIDVKLYHYDHSGKLVQLDRHSLIMEGTFLFQGE